MPVSTAMSRPAFKIHAYARYINIILIPFFLSDIPMPVNKPMLALCCSAALLGNLLINIYAYFTRNYPRSAYMLLILDLFTLMPAIYFSGMFGSPFLLFLPLTIYNVYFLGLKMRASTIFSVLALILFLGLALYSWHHIVAHPGWTPTQFPLYTGFVILVQLAAFSVIIYQAWRGPGTIMRELATREELLAKEMPRAQLGTSLSMIAHEVRNPLTTIAITLEHCRTTARELPAPTRRKLLRAWKTCANEIGRIDRMLENVLAYSRHDVGKYQITPVSARKVIDRAVQFTRKKHLVQQMSFSTICMVAKEQIIHCDEDAMHQVLTNLFDNAIQNRKPTERLRLEISLTQNRKAVALAVADNGVGIAPHLLPHVFQNYSSTRHGGTGLGLAVAQRIIQAHSGIIEVKSSPGVGATFIINLPAFHEGAPPERRPG